jgi:hypothetical protein
MKYIKNNIVVLVAAAALVLLGFGSAVADSQSNGNSIYEDGIDKLISSNETTGSVTLIARSQSNGNSIYEDNLGKLVG